MSHDVHPSGITHDDQTETSDTRFSSRNSKISTIWITFETAGWELEPSNMQTNMLEYRHSYVVHICILRKTSERQHWELYPVEVSPNSFFSTRKQDTTKHVGWKKKKSVLVTGGKNRKRVGKEIPTNQHMRCKQKNVKTWTFTWYQLQTITTKRFKQWLARVFRIALHIKLIKLCVYVDINIAVTVRVSMNVNGSDSCWWLNKCIKIIEIPKHVCKKTILFDIINLRMYI